MEACLLAIGLLGKCGLFLLQLVAEIEAFHIHIITTTYGDTVLRIVKY